MACLHSLIGSKGDIMKSNLKLAGVVAVTLMTCGFSVFAVDIKSQKVQKSSYNSVTQRYDDNYVVMANGVCETEEIDGGFNHPNLMEEVNGCQIYAIYDKFKVHAQAHIVNNKLLKCVNQRVIPTEGPVDYEIVYAPNFNKERNRLLAEQAKILDISESTRNALQYVNNGDSDGDAFFKRTLPRAGVFKAAYEEGRMFEREKAKKENREEKEYIYTTLPRAREAAARMDRCQAGYKSSFSAELYNAENRNSSTESSARQ